MTNVQANPRWRPALRFDHLFTIAALALVGAFIALVPTPPNDFWWHLRAGQIVAAEGIPTTNRFAWTLPADTPYIYATWLGEWLFFLISQVAGFPGVAVARNLLGVLGFALVALNARVRSGSWKLGALAVLLAGLMSINNLPIRTQNWSWVPFGLFLCILSAYAAGRARPSLLIALPLLMAFWVNAHGAFVLGLALVAIYAAGETARRWLEQGGALSWRQLMPLYLAGAATLAATLLNPLGPGIFSYVADLLTDQPSQSLINEWQPPNRASPAGFFFFGATLALVAGLALARRRPTLTDTLLVCAFLWLAWGGQRYVIWFGMVAMPVLAQSLAAPDDPAERPVGSQLANALIAAMLAGIVVAVQPPLKSQLPLPGAYARIFAAVPGAPQIFDSTTPVEATEWLRANQPGEGRLFNEMGYGSYLIWAAPEVPVFIDPRVELYPLQQWQDYAAITEGRDPQPLLDKYRVSRIMLDRRLQGGLSTFLQGSSAWRLEYRDPRSEIYRRAEELP